MNIPRFSQYARWMFIINKRYLITLVSIIASISLLSGMLHRISDPTPDKVYLYYLAGIIGSFLVGNHWSDLRKGNPKAERFLLLPASLAEKMLEVFLSCFVGFSIMAVVSIEGGYALGWGISYLIPAMLVVQPSYPHFFFDYNILISSWLLWSICLVGVFYFKKQSTLKTLLVLMALYFAVFFIEGMIVYAMVRHFVDIYANLDIPERYILNETYFSFGPLMEKAMLSYINIAESVLFVFFMVLGFFKLKEKETGR